MKFNLLNKQALKTTALIVSIMIIVVFLYYYFEIIDSFYGTLVIIVISFLTIYFSFKLGFNNLIDHQLKKLYKSTLFENEVIFKKNKSEADFENFLSNVKDFTDSKHKEIKELTNRDDFRRDFLGDIAHELKTPIFTAQGYLITLLDDSMKDSSLRKKYLERANKSIERLNFVVKDLDMISKLESGMNLNIESFNIIKLIADVFEMLEIKASKKNINLTFNKIYNIPILVYGDKDRIEQVLINLISNSIKYSKNDDTTTVSVDSYSKNLFIIKVSDTGLGIDKKDIPRIFERFYRVDKSRSREQGGSGLGLAIVKHIIEAHNQEVFVESTFGKGSAFSFTIDKVL